MVTIKKGERTLTVTMGAYTQLYKALGYHVIGHEGTHSAPLAHNEGNSYGNEYESPEDDFSSDAEPEEEYEEPEEYEEKPISEMNFEELKAYAEKMGITTNGVKSKSELRKAIRNRGR